MPFQGEDSSNAPKGHHRIARGKTRRAQRVMVAAPGQPFIKRNGRPEGAITNGNPRNRNRGGRSNPRWLIDGDDLAAPFQGGIHFKRPEGRCDPISAVPINASIQWKLVWEGGHPSAMAGRAVRTVVPNSLPVCLHNQTTENLSNQKDGDRTPWPVTLCYPASRPAQPI